MSMPSCFRKAAITRSVALVTEAQFSLPGCARAIANKSPSVLKPSCGGALIETSVADTRATGARSRAS